MVGKIIGILLLIALFYGVYLMYQRTWPGESVKETLSPFIIFNVEKSTSSRFGVRIRTRDWFRVYPPDVPRVPINEP